MPKKTTRGFTLIEMSIVLVIIGLLVGGVFIGRDLVNAAKVRKQITQIEQYDTAINTFKAKYNALPGDIAGASAIALGFTARSGNEDSGDNDGVVERCAPLPFSLPTINNYGCENILFWADLSKASLISENFTTASDINLVSIPASDLYLYFPRQALFSNAYIFLGYDETLDKNTYLLSLPTTTGIAANGTISDDNRNGASLDQQFMLDTKLDDGKALTGNIQLGVIGGVDLANYCIYRGNYNTTGGSIVRCPLSIYKTALN